MTTVLKLGGSVVTRKEEPETVDEKRLGAVAADIEAASQDDTVAGDLVVVHGGGSFGHHRADKHGVSATEGSADATAITDIHEAMTDLNRSVVGALQERGVGALPVRPLSVAHRDADGDLSFPGGQVAAMLQEGFTPVLHGDVVVQTGKGGTILSGDEIVVTIARSLSADRVGLCSTVPGVLDSDDEVIPSIDSYAEVSEVLGESAVTDVTGGMAGKVKTLLGVDVPAHVFDPAGLRAFLDGGTPGTVVWGGD